MGERRGAGRTDVAGFELLGETAARMHAHVRRWQRPPWFERHTWDFETSLGVRPHWGHWQNGMGMTPDAMRIFSETVEMIAERLQLFGKSPERFNLVHGDMRLANLLMDGSTVKVIDFDDCGFSWLLYDCATTVSFFEHTDVVPELLKAWVSGYRRIGSLTPEEENEIATFVMLRRLLLVAWIGSHSETDLAQSMGVGYTPDSVPLCERYLSRFSRQRVDPCLIRAEKRNFEAPVRLAASQLCSRFVHSSNFCILWRLTARALLIAFFLRVLTSAHREIHGSRHQRAAGVRRE